MRNAGFQPAGTPASSRQQGDGARRQDAGVPAGWKPALLPLHLLNRIRRALYRAGFLVSRRLPRPVISIGNIAMGGTGKTPLVIWLARALTERGLRVAVLTRGYGRRGSGGIVTDLDPSRFGDEPILIKKHTQKVDVIVGLNRYQMGADYLQSNSVDVFILDDGFQHMQLARDLDIVIDSPSARWLREGRSALRDADVVLVRGRDFHLRLTGLDSLRGERLFAFAALADNDQFFAALRSAGLDVAATRGFADHHPYSPADLDDLRRAAREAGTGRIVTTEKDMVKLGQATDISAVAAEVVIDGEQELVAGILARIESHGSPA